MDSHLFRRFRRLAVLSIATYLGFLVLLMFFERPMIYPAPPRSDGDWDPKWLTFENAEFRSRDGTALHGWFVEHPTPKGTLLFCHGNGEHVAYLANELKQWSESHQLSVMAFDYRGYGKSQGQPFERGVLEDGEAARKWLVERTGQSADSILLYGRSLGGAVAVHLASQGGARGIVLDRTFHSLVDIGAHHMPWFPVRLLMRNRYPVDRWIQGYDGPLLQIHGEDDEIVPVASARRLFEASPSTNKRLLVSTRMTHNAPWPPEYDREVAVFIDSLTPTSSDP